MKIQINANTGDAGQVALCRGRAEGRSAAAAEHVGQAATASAVHQDTCHQRSHRDDVDAPRVRYITKSRTVGQPSGRTAELTGGPGRRTIDLRGNSRRPGGRPRGRSAAVPRRRRSSWAFGQRVRKRQPRRRVDGCGTSPCRTMRLPFTLDRRVGLGRRRQQRLGVRMHRLVVDQLGRPDLHDLAEIHHGDACRRCAAPPTGRGR